MWLTIQAKVDFCKGEVLDVSVEVDVDKSLQYSWQSPPDNLKLVCTFEAFWRIISRLKLVCFLSS